MNRPDPRQSWAAKISAAWQRHVSAIFEVGDLLIAAKDALPHGSFEKMVANELRFGQRTADMLMAVARDKRLRKENPGSILPASWRTLYELTRFDDKQLGRAFDNGTIHPEMAREDVLGAVRPRQRLTRRERESLVDFVDLDARRFIDLLVDAQVRTRAVKLLSGERESDRAAVAAAVAELADRLRTKAPR